MLALDAEFWQTRMMAQHEAIERIYVIARERAERLEEYKKAWEEKWAKASGRRRGFDSSATNGILSSDSTPRLAASSLAVSGGLKVN